MGETAWVLKEFKKKNSFVFHHVCVSGKLDYFISNYVSPNSGENEV